MGDSGTTDHNNQTPSSSSTDHVTNATKPLLVLPWRTRLAVSIISVVTDTTRRPNGTINRRLLNLLDFKSSPTGPFKSNRSVISSDVTVDPSRNLWFRLYVPTGANINGTSATNPLPVLVFFHGGGFAFLSAASRAYDIVCQRFARRLPAIVVSVNYRLSPEHRFPSQYDDGFDVLQFLDHNLNTLLLRQQSSGNGADVDVDLSKCFLCGDSAGANLAHHVAVRTSRAQFRHLKVIGLVSIQPFFGGRERTESEIRLTGYPFVSQSRTDWLWKAFLPVGDHDRDHHAVNVSGPNAEDISGLDSFPETVVFVGGFDPLQDWQRRYYAWLKKSGKEVTLIEYPDMIHAFYIFPELSQSSQLFSQVKDFVAARIAKH